MKYLHYLIFGITLISLTNCGTRRLTREDVVKKVENAREQQSKAHEASTEAVNARKQFTLDYKAEQIKELDKRIKNIDKQMKKIKKSLKGSENETATQGLESATSALKAEKKSLLDEKKRIENIEQVNLTNSKRAIDSANNTTINQLDRVENSLEQVK